MDSPGVDWTAIIERAASPPGRIRHDAWASIYDACHQAVRLRVRGMLGSRRRFDLDDVVQDVFLLADQKFAQFGVVGDPLTSLRRWLCTMAYNHVIDRSRHEAAQPPMHTSHDPERVPISGEATAPRLVEELLDGLPEEDRLLLCLHGAEEMSFEEIVPEIVDFRRRQGLDEPVTAAALRQRWRRLRERLLNLAEGAERGAQSAIPQDEEP